MTSNLDRLSTVEEYLNGELFIKSIESRANIKLKKCILTSEQFERLLELDMEGGDFKITSITVSKGAPREYSQQERHRRRRNNKLVKLYITIGFVTTLLGGIMLGYGSRGIIDKRNNYLLPKST